MTYKLTNVVDASPERCQISVYRHSLKCDTAYCRRFAAFEWIMVDDDGSLYMTHRCPDHPESDPNYERRDIKQ